jgi:hypothetical protein
MKRQDLYNYIREEIINELTETTYAGKAATDQMKKDPKFNSLTPSAKANAINDLSKGGDVELEEAELSEMGRKGKGYKPGANLSKAKQVYTTSKLAQILELIENAGEDGITAKEIQAATGIKNLPQLYPLLGQLAAIGAIIDPKATVSVSEPETEKPETTEPEMADKDEDEVEIEKDEYEQPEEEEDVEIEVEPSAADLKAAEKIASVPSGKEAEINTVVSKIKTIAGKIENLTGSEYDAKLKALKQFVANNKGLLKGVDLNSITNGLIS